MLRWRSMAACSSGPWSGRAALRRWRTAALALLWLFVAAGAALGQAPPSSAAPKSITVVMDDNYPPFVFRDSNGQLQGILKDTWALWQAHTGIAVRLQAMDWAKAQQAMLAGQADVIDTIFVTEPRRRLYDFTAPYAKLEVPIFFHQSISGIVNADSLKGFTVGVKDGDACIDVLRGHGVDSMKTYPSYTAVISAASAGEVRVFCVDQPPALYLLNQLGVEKDFRRSVPLYSGEFHRAVAKGNAALLKVLEAGFEQITASERQAIEDKWYGSVNQRDIPPFFRYGAYALLGAVVAALILTVWSLALRRRVAAKTAELSQSLEALGAAKRSAEQALAQLDATLGAIPDLLFETDIEGRYLDHRAGRADLLVLPPEQLIGRTVSDVMPPAAAQSILEALRQASRHGSSTGAQFRLDLPQGEHWFELSIARKRSGSVEGERFVVLSRDITDRKRAETALQQSEQSFRHFFEAGLVGMAITVPDKHWGKFNQRLAEMFGYSPQELNDLTWSGLTHPDDLAADEANFQRVMAGQTDGYTMDKRFIRKDGEVLHASIAVRCERNEQGQAERFFAVVEDISQRKRAEAALTQHRDELERLVQARSRELVDARDVAVAASRAKSEFLSSMSHELRTPLNAIMGFSQLLELDRELSPRSLRFAKEILNAGKHLLHLINEVLDLAQVESGRIALTPEALHLAAIGQEVLTLMQPLADQRGVTLQAGAFDGLVVRADRMRLKQVLVNIVSNAIKYNRPAGRVSVETTALDEQTVRITVRDTGVGIAPERLSQVFEPFNRLGAESGSIEGTGIGLSICKRLVELMGGHIGVSSRAGEGSKFWVDLRRDLGAKIEPGQRHAVTSRGPAPTPGRAAELLYVEDNAANLQLMQDFIGRQTGWQLRCATSAAAGLASARAPARPDPARHQPARQGRPCRAGRAARRRPYPRHPDGGRDRQCHAQR
ncbi:MAG: transporter substrate-binding domain-containing protein [Ideonella sp.]|nr:transporter substrate-binding domain-containing protein [Ideonella sp.]